VIKTLAKKILFGSLHSLGIDRLQFCSHAPARVFFGHRVFAEGKAGDFFEQIASQGMEVTSFARRVRWLQRHWHFVSMDGLFTTDSSTLDAKAALTFDDAYADWETVVVPLLADLRIPATFFITVDALDQTRLLWFDQVYSTFAEPSANRVAVDSLDGKEFTLNTTAQRVAAAVKVCDLLSRREADSRENVVSELVGKLGTGPLRPETLYLTKQQAARIAEREWVTIGSHTLSHPNLLLLSIDEVRRELTESKRRLEQISGKAVRHLSYPNGFWNDQIAAIAKECGYWTASATARGVDGNHYALPRTNVGWWRDAEFFVRTSPSWRFLGR
jgi:peptidoglycan/xylan/chitin deacetylase (PgdA/CDA1 family)